MFDTSQSTSVDRMLESPEEKSIVLKDDSILEEIRQEDALDTFKDYEFISLIRSEILEVSEELDEDREELARQLPFAPVRYRILSRLLRFFGWRYFHRVGEGEILENIEIDTSGKVYAATDEITDEKLLTGEDEETKDDALADLIKIESDEIGGVLRVAKRFFITDLLHRIRKLFFRSNTIIGFDIGTEYVKYTQIRRYKSRIVLDHYHVQEIARKPGDSVDVFRGKVALALQKIIPHDLLSIADVTVSFSDLPVIIKRETLPVMAKKELHQAIMFRAQKLVPQNIKEPEIQYEIVEKSESKGASQVVARIYVCDKTELYEWINVLKDCGISPEKVTFPHRAIQLSLRRFYPLEMSEGTVVFDFGGTKSQLIFTEKGTIKLIRNIDIGVNEFVSALTGQISVENETVDIDAKAAGTLLKTYGISDASISDKAEIGIPVARIGIMLYDPIEKLILELQRSIDFFRSNFPDAPLLSMLVMGGGSEIKNLFGLLQEKLGFPMKRFSFLHKVTIGRDITETDQLLKDAYMLHGSIGLALDSTSELNLLPEAKQNRKKNNIVLLSGFILTALAVTFLTKVSLGTVEELRSVEREHNAVNSEWEEKIKPLRDEYDAFVNQRNDAANMLKYITKEFEAQSGEDSIENILKLFSMHALPEGIVINKIYIYERRAENFESGDSFVTKRAPRNIIVKGITTAVEVDRSILEYILYLRTLSYFDRIEPQQYEGQEYNDDRYFQLSIYLRETLDNGSK